MSVGRNTAVHDCLYIVVYTQRQERRVICSNPPMKAHVASRRLHFHPLSRALVHHYCCVITSTIVLIIISMLCGLPLLRALLSNQKQSEKYYENTT